MVVSDIKRWAFVAVPKAGTTTLQVTPGGVLLHPAFGGRYVGDPDDGHRMDAPAGYFTFAVWRDPWERAESMFKHLRDAHPDHPDAASFPAFVRSLPAGEGNFHWPQSRWWGMVPGGIDRLVRLDRLAEGLGSMGLHDGPMPEVPRLNARPAPPMPWTDELRSVVAGWARESLSPGIPIIPRRSPEPREAP